METGLLFTTTRGTMLDAGNMLREYYRVRDLAGLTKIRFHYLRHSNATLLRAAAVADAGDFEAARAHFHPYHGRGLQTRDPRSCQIAPKLH